MKEKRKYILILFISLYIAKCLSAIILKFFIIINPLILRIILIALCFLFLSILNFKGSWISIEKRTNNTSERNFGLDVVRTIAVIFVPTIHFFGLSGYYNTQFSGKTIIFASMLRWLSVCAVPIFMLLTGYFKINKSISKNHYMSIFPVLYTHIFISAIRIIIDYQVHNIDVNLDYILNKMLYFEYGWYVKLYIGMLLLIPFFNIMYKNCDNRENKEILIMTFILLTSIGDLVFDIIPKSWLILYVFMYYLIGAYLREYQVKINKFVNLIFIFFVLSLTTISVYIKCNNEIFDWNFIGYDNNSGYSSIPVIIISFLIMVLCMDLKCNNKVICGLFKSISVVSLEMYLFSQMFDGLIYKQFVGYDFIDYFNKFIIIVPTVLVLSYLSAYIKKIPIIFLKPLNFSSHSKTR